MIKFVQKQLCKVVVWIILNIVTYFLCKYFEVKFLFSPLFSLISSGFIFFFGKTWLEDYKGSINKDMEIYKNNLNVELEGYKAKLSGYTLVTKLQFELEFKIYTEIYEALDEVQGTLALLNNYLDGSNPARNISQEKYNDFVNACNKQISIKRKYRPFYLNEVFDSIETLMEIYRVEGTKIENEKMWHDGSFNENESNERKNRILIETKKLATLISDRIKNMKIIE